MKLSNSKVKELAQGMIDAWITYNTVITNYMHGLEEFNNVRLIDQPQYWRQQYERWVKASQSFQNYTHAIRRFSSMLHWSAVIEVAYGEIVGFHIPDTTSLIFVNAYGGRDDETALGRYGADKKFFMRIGGLPEGTYIFSQKANYRIDRAGQPVLRIIKPESAA